MVSKTIGYNGVHDIFRQTQMVGLWGFLFFVGNRSDMPDQQPTGELGVALS